MADRPRLRLWPIVRLPYRAGRAMLSLAIDRLVGVETTLLVNELTIRPGRPPLYEHIPVGWLTMWRVLRHLDIGADDVLYDVGAGSGRALLVASRFPFRRLVGIELSSELHAVAQANLSRCRRPPTMPVRIICGDALVEPLPEDATIVFFYNPFDGEVFDRFIRHMLDAIERYPRPLRFVYLNPQAHDRLVATGRFRLVDRLRGMRPTHAWSQLLATHIYEVQPA